ncbi:MAG: NAD(P)/FAD-dependent oxidoreductase, partial [Caulobacteraceae bacterium]
KVSGNGWLIAGDAGQFVNSLHREGSNMAMTTGRMAGETIVALMQAGKPMTAANLASYRKRLDDSYVMKDLRKYRDLPSVLHKNKQFVTTYPELLAQAASTWFRVDGVDKRTKEREIVRSFRRGRSIRGMISDAFKIARAVR